MEEITILTTSSESNENNIAQEFYNTLTHDCPFIAEDNEKENVNKLKRKKQLSNSLSSIHGNVDEKRKKFEANARMEKSLIAKPPLPPPRNVQNGGRANPPPRLKRKLEENSLIIGRLNAQSDQLRVEITNLKTALQNEKAAVRTLRAQNEGEVRKLRGEVKKLQSYLESKKRKKPAAQPPTTALKKESSFSDKLNQEVLLLKETKKSLEEKLSTNCSADRRKLYDIRELKDSYEIRLTHLSKSAKNEISRLLEEIKTKERNIGQLKSKINFMELNNNNKPATKTMQKVHLDKKDKDLKMSQNPKEINKLKNTDHDSITKKSIILHMTTCGEKEFHSMPHERNERIIEAQNDIFNKDHQNSSDTDSALSSAPPSISPQPQLNGMESADIWQTIKTYSSDLEKLQKDYSFLLRENENLREELSSAKKQIEEFEKTVIEANNNAKLQELVNTINFLEKKEYSLSQENHELQEQNELLEFRILELEGSHDKWSNNSSALDNKEDMWCDTGKFSEDALLFTPRSDSGITSPHSHNIDLLDHIPNEELRRRLSLIYKKPNLEEEEKQCLQQVLNLIQNLDSMSNESISSDEPISLEIVKSRTTELDSSNQSLPTHQKASKSCLSNNNHRIVATISPYTTTSFASQCSSPSDTPKRLRNWQTTSLSESGVFEGDSFENFSQSTQTEAEDLLEIFSTSHASRDLCAEIQKLTKFREEIEESSSVPSSSVIDLQKRLHYYKDRVEVLEGKLIIYESSGDLQTKRLADRLQREVQLESSVKELSDRVDILKLENSILEEEKCEFEEAENDTRLKLQRLEVDLEILSQRNVELEVSREAFQQKLNETKQLNLEIQQEFQKSQDRVELLENESKELLETLSLLKNRRHSREIKMDTCESNNKTEEDICHQDRNGNHSPMENETKIIKLQSEIHNLREREQKLICEIKRIQLHYREVMENADHHWKQLETNLTSQLAEACSNEACLKTKILQLEKRLFCDSSAAQEKIACLEESEDELKKCLNKLTRDNRRLNEDYCALNEELKQCREEFNKTNQADSKCLDQEKCRNKELSDECDYLKKSLAESEGAGKQELQCLKHELCRVKKELLQIEVTNAELREEVCTLENTISDLQKICKKDTEKIRCLGDELRDRDDLCDQMERKLNKCTCGSKSKGPKNCNKANQNTCGGEEISLAQELGEDKCPSKKLKREEVKDLKHASHLLGQALDQMEKDLEAKQFNSQILEEDQDNLDNLDHKYVPCHCCRDKMSDSSNEHLFERQIGGTNSCQRKRIHANVNDFNDTVWLDAIDKINECSRNIGQSLAVCEAEETQTPKENPASKKSSKSIYVDCHSRPFQDCVEEPTPVVRKTSNTKAKRSLCEHIKLKNVFNAIDDLYGLANEHRSQHQCPNCGGFKQSRADFCDPCEDYEIASNKESRSKWIPVNDDNCLDQADVLELNELVDACSSGKDTTRSWDEISEITRRIEEICASIGCNQCSRKDIGSNQSSPRREKSMQSSESCVPQSRGNSRSRCQHSVSEYDEQEEPSCKPVTKQQTCHNREQSSNPCNMQEPRRDQRVPQSRANSRSRCQYSASEYDEQEEPSCKPVTKQQPCNNREQLSNPCNMQEPRRDQIVPQSRANSRSRCQNSASEYDEREDPSCKPIPKQQPCNNREQLSNNREQLSNPCNMQEPRRDQRVPQSRGNSRSRCQYSASEYDEQEEPSCKPVAKQQPCHNREQLSNTRPLQEPKRDPCSKPTDKELPRNQREPCPESCNYKEIKRDQNPSYKEQTCNPREPCAESCKCQEATRYQNVPCLNQTTGEPCNQIEECHEPKRDQKVSCSNQTSKQESLSCSLQQQQKNQTDSCSNPTSKQESLSKKEQLSSQGSLQKQKNQTDSCSNSTSKQESLSKKEQSPNQGSLQQQQKNQTDSCSNPSSKQESLSKKEQLSKQGSLQQQTRDPTYTEQLPDSSDLQEEKRDPTSKEILPDQDNQRPITSGSQGRSGRRECDKKYSCPDICNEPSYSNLKDCGKGEPCQNGEDLRASGTVVPPDVLCSLNRICDILVKNEKNLKKNQSTKCESQQSSCNSRESENLSRSSRKDQPCQNDGDNIKASGPVVPPELLCTLKRICDSLVNYEKDLKKNQSTKCESQQSSCNSRESANVSRSSFVNDHRSGQESDGFTSPKPRVSVSILEEIEEINTEHNSGDEPLDMENISLPVTCQTTERTTSFHAKECVTADCEAQTANSSPGCNGSAPCTPATHCGQGCCFPCIPIFPMPMCADSCRCWPFMCCPKEVRNCPNDEGHTCKGSCNNSNGNGGGCGKDNDKGVQKFVQSLLCDLNDMKKTLNNCMEGSGRCDASPRCPTCRPPPSPVCCQGYPVSIHCVKPLGNKSLMVYWIVHDFRDISGYEIRMDGCMKNRYFTSGHDCAVVYGVDLCVPHEIELVAIPELKSCEIPTDEDLSKSLVPIATQAGKRKSHFQSNGSVWTPSIYIYDPMKQ